MNYWRKPLKWNLVKARNKIVAVIMVDALPMESLFDNSRWDISQIDSAELEVLHQLGLTKDLIPVKNPDNDKLYAYLDDTVAAMILGMIHKGEI